MPFTWFNRWQKMLLWIFAVLLILSLGIGGALLTAFSPKQQRYRFELFGEPVTHFEYRKFASDWTRLFPMLTIKTERDLALLMAKIDLNALSGYSS